MTVGSLAAIAHDAVDDGGHDVAPAPSNTRSRRRAPRTTRRAAAQPASGSRIARSARRSGREARWRRADRGRVAPSQVAMRSTSNAESRPGGVASAAGTTPAASPGRDRGGRCRPRRPSRGPRGRPPPSRPAPGRRPRTASGSRTGSAATLAPPAGQALPVPLLGMHHVRDAGSSGQQARLRQVREIAQCRSARGPGRTSERFSLAWVWIRCSSLPAAYSAASRRRRPCRRRESRLHRHGKRPRSRPCQSERRRSVSASPS